MPQIKKIQQHKLLLDTHVWLWLMSHDKSLSKSFTQAVDRVAKREAVFVSAISVWEIGMLENKGRISLGLDTMDWIDEALDLPGIELATISPRIAIQSTRLPDELKSNDPADRMLIATARELNAVLVTCDEAILDYGKGKFISVHNPQS